MPESGGATTKVVQKSKQQTDRKNMIKEFALHCDNVLKQADLLRDRSEAFSLALVEFNPVAKGARLSEALQTVQRVESKLIQMNAFFEELQIWPEVQQYMAFLEKDHKALEALRRAAVEVADLSS